MLNTQYIKLNMVPSGVMPILYCSQYDVGRPLGMVVYNGSEVVDLDAYTCTIEATRTDGTAITAAVSTDDNIGVFLATATMTNKADKYFAKLVLFDSNARRVASLTFVMCVTVATMDENAESISEDASLYQQYTGTVQTIIADVRARLDAEVSARVSAVSAEATARQNADTALQNAINAEATARQNADTTLQSNITAEASARASAVSTLQGDLSAEVSARASADTILQAEIDQLVAPTGSAPSAAEVQDARIGADGVTYNTLGAAIRTNDTNLQRQIFTLTDCEQTIYGLADWVNGGLNLNADHTALSINTDQYYRVTSLDVLSFTRNVELKVASGFRIVPITKTGGVYYDKGWLTGTVIIPAGTEFCLIIARTSDVHGVNADIGEFTSKVTIKTVNSTDIDMIEQMFDIISEKTKNLLVPSQTLNAYFNSSDQLTYTQNYCSVYIKCNANTTYTVSKTAGTRFAVAYTTALPTFDMPVLGRVSNYEASAITITTGSNAEYLVAWIYNATDTISFADMLASVQIEEGSAATSYVAPYTAVDKKLRDLVIEVNHGDVTTGSDADDLLDDGFYLIGYSVNVSNAPESTGRRILFVQSGGVNPNYKNQLFFNITTGSIYGRAKTSSGWESWSELGNKNGREICGMFDGRLALSHGGIPRRTAYQNSPKAFREARRIGIFYNDIDVTFTSDKVPIVVHDSEVVPYGETDPVVFRNITYEQLQAYDFGDADYTWKIQTLKEAYELNLEIGCKIGVDIGYLTSGAMPYLLSYMRDNGIKPLYLVSSELTTFNQFVSNSAYDFPLGIVLHTNDSTEYATQKLTALLNMQTTQHLPKCWAFFRHEMIEDTSAPFYSYVDDLLNAGITIESYSYNTLTEIANAKLPSYISAWGGDAYNVNYERYKLAMSED